MNHLRVRRANPRPHPGRAARRRSLAVNAQRPQLRRRLRHLRGVLVRDTAAAAAIRSAALRLPAGPYTAAGRVCPKSARYSSLHEQPLI